jgi:hypothetical protein
MTVKEMGPTAVTWWAFFMAPMRPGPRRRLLTTNSLAARLGR